jgi:integrase/recombinase XerC
MLSSEMNHFLAYCKVSGFSDKSIETLALRLKDFYEYLMSVFVFKPEDISYHHLKEFITLYGKTSVHVKKAKVWTLHQFFHFLQLNGRISENIALQIPYPKIEKTVPKFLTIQEFNRLL